MVKLFKKFSLSFKREKKEDKIEEREGPAQGIFLPEGISRLVSVEEVLASGLDLIEYLATNRGMSYSQVAELLAKNYQKGYASKVEVVDIVDDRLISSDGRSCHYLPLSSVEVVVPKDFYESVYFAFTKRGKDEETGEISEFVYERIIKHFKDKAITDVFIDADRDAYHIHYKELGGGKRHYLTVSYEKGVKIVEHLKAKASRYSEVNLSIRDEPQSGKISYEELGVEVRIEFIPSPFGEGVSLRFLPVSGYFSKRLVDLGYPEDITKALQELSRKAQGFILVGGPTGSGKSTMIKAMLIEMDPEKRVIRAVEDPVETPVKGVMHVQASENLSFARAIRSFMRANPDVIFVGEIRDSETALAFIEASMTGHLALSTIHANNSVENLQRLTMKIVESGKFSQEEVYKIMAGNLLGSISTRLVKRKDGKGVVPLVELFLPDEEERILIEKGNFLALERRMKEKGRDLYSVGMKMVKEGLIDEGEVVKYLIT